MPTHFTPIPNGTGVTITQDAINSPLQELDDAIVGLEAGTVAAANGGRLSAEGTTLVISSDTITRTQNRHVIDTEGAAASDELATINGLVDGLIIYLQIANSGRVVTVKHNTDNILLANGADLVMNSTQMVLALVGSSRLGKWVEIGDGYALIRENLAATLVPVNQLTLPDRVLIGSTTRQRRLAVQPSWEVSNQFQVRAAAATVQPIGVAAPTVANTPAEANDDTGALITLPTTAASGNLGGFISATFDLIWRVWDPVMTWWVKTDSDITSQRLWVGAISAAITNVDTIAGATEFMGFRWSTVAGDAGWKPVTKDATTQNEGTAIGTVIASTWYKLRMRVDSSNGIVYFSVNDSAEQSLNANLPAASTELGYLVRCINQVAAIRLMNFNRMTVEMK